MGHGAAFDMGQIKFFGKTMRQPKNTAMEKKGQFWNEKIEMLPPKEMKALQWKRLKRQLRYNYENSVYYREEKFHRVGLTPDKIRTLEDFQKIEKSQKHLAIERPAYSKDLQPDWLLNTVAAEIDADMVDKARIKAISHYLEQVTSKQDSEQED